MPLPLILGIGAGIAAVSGVGAGIAGGVKMKEANDTMKLAESKRDNAIAKFERENKACVGKMDKIGKKELIIVKSFEDFSKIISKIQGRPEFAQYSKNGVNIADFTPEELEEASVGAAVLLGGLGGAAAGTAGGFAAAGVATSAVMAFGAASTGTAISSLSGVAATNATLAALGGGSLAVGGGGMALGTAVLGGATLGVGLLVGGIIFNITGSKLSDQADEAYSQACKTEREVDEIVTYLKELQYEATKFETCLDEVNRIYKRHIQVLNKIVNINGKINWYEFTEAEKLATENTVLLVGVLYNMCKIELVKKTKKDVNEVNSIEIERVIDDANEVREKIDYI